MLVENDTAFDFAFDAYQNSSHKELDILVLDKYRDKNNNNALTYAAGRGKLEIVKYLLGRDGVDIYHANRFGSTVMTYTLRRAFGLGKSVNPYEMGMWKELVNYFEKYRLLNPANQPYLTPQCIAELHEKGKASANNK